MKKYIVIPISIETVRYPGQTTLKLIFSREAIQDWCLGLCLLKEDLIETLVVREENGKKTFDLQKVDSASALARPQISVTAEKAKLKITPGTLDYLLYFFLKYYRDGVAEVDHIDLQTVSPEGEEDFSYVILVVPDFVPPVSPEEVKRRLGLD